MNESKLHYFLLSMTQKAIYLQCQITTLYNIVAGRTKCQESDVHVPYSLTCSHYSRSFISDQRSVEIRLIQC